MVTSSPSLNPESILTPGVEGGLHIDSLPIAGRKPFVTSSA